MIRKVCSIVLALLVFLPNCSLALAAHSCGGKVVDAGLIFGTGNLSCGSPNMDTVCEAEDMDAASYTSQLKAAPCCLDSKVFLDVEDRYHSEISAEIDKLNKTFALLFASLERKAITKNLLVYSIAPAPPEIVIERMHLYQVYRL